MEASKIRRIRVALSKSEVFRYLVCGGLAAFIALATRIFFSQWMSFDVATLCAQGVSLVAGYYLYRSFVWTQTTRSIRATILPFLAVNFLSVVVVMAAAIVIRMLLSRLLGASQVVDTTAHAAGIVSGACVSLIGHRTFTFRTS